MKDKYQLLNELQFQLGLAQRYAIILEQRISNRMEVEPYHNLMRTALIEVNGLDTQLIKLFAAQQEAA